MFFATYTFDNFCFANLSDIGLHRLYPHKLHQKSLWSYLKIDPQITPRLAKENPPVIPKLVHSHLKATSLHHSYNLYVSRENDSGAGFDHWYNECFEPMEPPPITWAELLPSLTVYS